MKKLLRAWLIVCTVVLGGMLFSTATPVSAKAKAPTLSEDHLVLGYGEQSKLTVKGSTGTVTWVSADTRVATVATDGTVYAAGFGSTFVTATVGSSKLYATITVDTASKYIVTGDLTSSSLDNDAMQAVQKAASLVSSKTSNSMSDIKKIRVLHDYLVNHCEYDYEGYTSGTVAENSYTAYGALINGNAVCQGYADAFKLCLDKLGIANMLRYGESNGDTHVWNLILLDNKWYQVDVTWDDPVSDINTFVRYDYFMIPDKQIKKDHTWDASLYPTCTSETYMYYVYKNNIISSISKYDKKFKSLYQDGNKVITILYPEKKYPSSKIIGKYVHNWNYFNLKKFGKYYIFTVVLP